MARKKAHEPHQNHERWLVSYADFITLLFAFFVVMYAISQVDAEKLTRLLRSMQNAFSAGIFHSQGREIVTSKGTAAGLEEKAPVAANNPLMTLEMPTFGTVEEAVTERLKQENATALVSVYTDPRGLVISLAEAGFFDSGRAEIRDSALKILDAIAQSLLPFGNHMRIEGHTDNIPIHNLRFNSNWELSSARATFVIDYLLRHYSFAPHKLSAAGYGEYHPIANNNLVEGRARNRRVDIVVLNPATAGQEPQ